MNLADLTVAELARGIRTGDVTASQVLEDCLARIDERDASLNAFSVILADEARAAAAQLDEAWQPEGLGPLYGVPIAVKEEIDVQGCVTTFGGRANTTPAARDGEVVRRLRAAGAIIIGKTKMPEFGQWPFTESVAYGITRNPWDTTKTPGGSSGGTAVAVAAGMVPAGIGGDGGGSIRIPAACCGLFGLKPERGRVTSDPAPHLWWGLGTAGPLTRTVLDSAIIYDVIRGSMPADLFTATEPRMSFTEAVTTAPGRLRIGWSTKPTAPDLKPDLQGIRAVRETADLLARLGHEVREVDPQYPDPTLAFVPQFFAGVRTESDAVEHYDRLERRTRETYRLGGWVRPRVIRAALRANEKVSAKANRIFEGTDGIDLLLTPTLAQRPPEIGQLDNGGTVKLALRSRPMVAYTALWNVTGNPAASVPCGVGPDGLPLAVQLVGRRADETTILSVSAQLEAARPWAMPYDAR